MPAYFVVALASNADGSTSSMVLDHVVAADLAAAQTKVQAAAARYLQGFPAGSQVQAGLIQTDAVVTVRN